MHVAAAVERYGRIDIIFNNAGISGGPLPFHAGHVIPIDGGYTAR
jgi:NAD(P)-dependent dehydrogenase (short-subunit alcohol dehydrogenase family)